MTQAKAATNGMTLRQAARKAGMQFTMGFERCYINGEPVEFRDAREVIGRKLLYSSGVTN